MDAKDAGRLIQQIQQKFETLEPFMNERLRRLWAASEAQALGWGGIDTVAKATGLSPTTISAGLREAAALREATPPPPASAAARPAAATPEAVTPEAVTPAAATAVLAPGRIRRPGGGRQPLTAQDVTVSRDLEALVEPVTRGDPQSPLRWSCKSAAKLARELCAQGHAISERSVNSLLHALGYSLQANRKTHEGGTHPDRNAQFEHINAQTRALQERGQPVISVDAKKKELVGAFKNGGREWSPQGQPEAVQVHDFMDPELGKAIPYGVYDLTTNHGWVSVGVDHDTAQFAVATIRRWWQQMGCPTYPSATELMIVADGGGSNSTRSRLWKTQLQALADQTGLRLRVCHLPPGTSKWNKIEHRMFSYITLNWRGRPLVSHEVIVNLIGSTTTRGGLRLQAALDRQAYPCGIKVSDAELAQVRLERDSFHGEWNYTIRPNSA